MPYRNYTLDEQANWLLMLDAAGYPDNPAALSRVAAQRGAPSKRTLKRWDAARHEPPAKLPTRQEVADSKRPDLIERLTRLLDLHIDAAEYAIQDAEDIRAIDTGIGILVDKIRLLGGESTENNAVDIRIRYANPDD